MVLGRGMGPGVGGVRGGRRVDGHPRAPIRTGRDAGLAWRAARLELASAQDQTRDTRRAAVRTIRSHDALVAEMAACRNLAAELRGDLTTQ